MLLIDGVVAGVWHQRRSGRKVHITVEPLEALGGAQMQELEATAKRIAEIQEGQAALTIGPITIGPHA